MWSQKHAPTPIQIKLCEIFFALFETKLCNSDIRKLMNDTQFVIKIIVMDTTTWLPFNEIVRKYLGNNKNPYFN